ncbi:MAG: cation:proton antiporter [Thermoplasmata archaeon]|nr:MAG: cation:proton antiporter [Thermoplasmata archaeon]HDJ27081.1 cation:proton antiporter [Aciduliprofundum sp.]
MMNPFIIGIGGILFGVFLAILRLVIGPDTPNRVVAVDTINTYVVALMVLLAAVFDRAIYVDIAIVYALLSYLATLLISRSLPEVGK